MKRIVSFAAIFVAVWMLVGCASLGSGNLTMRGKRAEDTPPTRVSAVKDVPVGQSTYHYLITIYPGLDENFNPHPTLTLQEYNEIAQLDWYCAKEVDKLSGQFGEMLKQGFVYGAIEGFFGMVGYKVGFGDLIRPGDYLAAIGLTAAGGGLASGKITYDTMLNVAHGYCMTGMVYKADQLEGKLTRIFITPLYVGNAKVPETSDKPAPEFSKSNGSGIVGPPVR